MRRIERSLAQVATWLAAADRITVLSGAGLSKASGIPTYRDAGGLWTNPANLRFADIDEFRRDPAGFTEFWTARRREMAQTRPNPGHLALARLQHLKPEAVLITQNVDGLLTRAGAVDVLELHGNLARDRCENCGAIDAGIESGRCTACGGPAARVRPDVVMFGEYLDERVIAKAELASREAQVFLLVGTSAVVFPAAGLAQKALYRGAKLVEINPHPTDFTDVAQAALRAPAEAVLPQLVRFLDR